MAESQLVLITVSARPWNSSSSSRFMRLPALDAVKGGIRCQGYMLRLELNSPNTLEDARSVSKLAK